eukprot:4823778-Pyramimonas_sp.AAC.1
MHLGPLQGKAVGALDVSPLGLRQAPVEHCMPVDAVLLPCWPSEGGEHPGLHVLAVLGRPLRAAVAPVCPVDLCHQVAVAVAVRNGSALPAQ